MRVSATSAREKGRFGWRVTLPAKMLEKVPWEDGVPFLGMMGGAWLALKAGMALEDGTEVWSSE